MKTKIKQICIIREHDKICLLEKLIVNLGLEKQIQQNVEHTISNYIDSCINNNTLLSTYYLKALEETIDNKTLLHNILIVASSIIQLTPLNVNIENAVINEKTIQYFSMPEILPLL